MPSIRLRESRLPLVVVLALIAASCRGPTNPKPSLGACSAPNGKIDVQVASYDIAVGEPSRFIAGLLTGDNQLISWGTVSLRFAYCGTKSRPQLGTYTDTATGTFLPIPPEEGEGPAPTPVAGPIAGPALKGLGVYSAQVGFDQSGFWRVEVSAELKELGPRTGVGDFEVLPKHLIAATGDAALPTENKTVDSPDTPKIAIDSRAGDNGAIPDPELHHATISQALKEHRPALVVFSTPVYCVSRFCGPVTEMVRDLALAYPNRAHFIHIEIWRNRQSNSINKAAADWLLRNDDLTEPWVFLIGADGKIAARWDNVATREEVEPMIRSLPAG